MSESSEEIANDMPAVPPQEIANAIPAGPNYSFYLKMKPHWTLRLALEALLDPNFNNGGYGTVGAASDSLVISMKDNVNATATLLMKPSGTIEFQNYALPPLMVKLLTPLHLMGIPRYLDGDGDDHTVGIYHLKGTDRLEFEFGTDPPASISAQIEEIPCVTMFPRLTVLSAITVPAQDISDMCDCILPEQDPSNDTVFVNWKEGLATFQIGSDEKWEYRYGQNERAFHGWFNWRYTEFMKEASYLADNVRVHFLTVPEQHVLFQFRIGESADLFLLQKARLVISDLSTEEVARDEDVSDSVTLDNLFDSWMDYIESD